VLPGHIEIGAVGNVRVKRLREDRDSRYFANGSKPKSPRGNSAAALRCTRRVTSSLVLGI
jgi:hypothetical protein